MTRVELMLERIDQVLRECDARTLPPLTSGPAAAVLDLADQAGLELTPWQESLVRSMYVAEPDGGLRLQYATTMPRDAVGSVVAKLRARAAEQQRPGWLPSEVIVDEVAAWMAPEPRRPWWRRWWSR